MAQISRIKLKGAQKLQTEQNPCKLAESSGGKTNTESSNYSTEAEMSTIKTELVTKQQKKNTEKKSKNTGSKNKNKKNF